MRNIQVATDLNEIKNRIKSLSPHHSAKWGLMNLQEMLMHCTKQLQLALGEIKADNQGSMIMRTKLGRWISLSAIPWPRSVLTPKEMNMAKQKLVLTEVESEKTIILDYLDKVKQAENLEPHPFFGKLSRQEWARLVYKHLDHHLKQFGA